MDIYISPYIYVLFYCTLQESIVQKFGLNKVKMTSHAKVRLKVMLNRNLLL